MAAPLPCLTIAGPTASGKSELALEIAERINGDIIGADAFQIYRGMGVLTAQTPENERRGIPHHLVGCIDPAQDFDVATYLKLAREKIIEVRAAGRKPILVGGTGLYIRAVLRGLAEGLPAADPILRAQMESESLEDLIAKLVKLDPAAATSVDLRNPRRVIRALEVCLLTGAPFTSFRAQTTPLSAPVGIWITSSRSELHARIELRAISMLKKGALDEIENIDSELGLTANQAIGVSEIRKFLRGQSTLERVKEELVFKTRQYAKRQESWFSKDNDLVATSKESAIESAQRVMNLPPKPL
jgi:tRNA dimethylallyltransferase